MNAVLVDSVIQAFIYAAFEESKCLFLIHIAVKVCPEILGLSLMKPLEEKKKEQIGKNDLK